MRKTCLSPAAGNKVGLHDTSASPEISGGSGRVIAVCGWKNSGKTSLLESVIPELKTTLGLKIAVIKHDAHRVDVDKPGTDSDRLFNAGADILLESPREELWRKHKHNAGDLEMKIRSMLKEYDLVLVEGHKSTPLPKIWLQKENCEEPPPECSGLIAVLPPGRGRVSEMLELVLSRFWGKIRAK